jgi:hypothetical protein
MKRFAVGFMTVFVLVAGRTWAVPQVGVVPMLTHSVDGVLFSESFENQTVTGVQGTGAPTTANVSPGVAGNQDEWFVIASGGASSTVLNRDASSDAALDAYEGSRYARVNRPDGNPAILIGDFGPDAGYGSGVLTMAFAVYIEGPLNSTKGMVFRFDNLADGTQLSLVANIAMQIVAQSDGNIVAPNLAGSNVDTGLDWTPDTWQEWVIIYDLDTDTFSLTVDGMTASGLQARNNLSNVSRFTWQALGNNSGSFYVDAIPDYSSAAEKAKLYPMLTHSADGDLFYEGFERQTVTGVQTTGAPKTLKLHPGVSGIMDQWFVIAQGGASTTVLNRDGASDTGLDAYEGSQYVRINRPNNQTAMLIGDFGPDAGYGSGVLTLRFAMQIEGPLGSGKGMVLRFDNLADGEQLGNMANVALQIVAFADGAIKYYTGSYQNTGLTWTPDTWQKWILAYDVGAGTFTLNVDGITANGTEYNNLSNVSRFTWQALGDNSGSFYIDAIPQSAKGTVISVR